MFLQTVVAVSHIQRGIISYIDDDLSHLAIGCFVCQFFVFNPIMAILTLKRTVAHIKMQEFEKDKIQARTVQGRVKLRVK